jgi:hypothetical protein
LSFSDPEDHDTHNQKKTFVVFFNLGEFDAPSTPSFPGVPKKRWNCGRMKEKLNWNVQLFNGKK